MKRVAVVCGGFSHEAKISFMSADTVMGAISPDLWEAYRVTIVKDGWTVTVGENTVPLDRADFSFSVNGEKKKFDCAFITIHGTPGEDGILQAYFDLLGIPYTTCNAVCSSLTFNKWFCNEILKQQGVNCAQSLILRKGDGISATEIINQVGLPCFVKPNNGGSSFGVTKVKAQDQVENAVKEAFEHGTEVMVEAFMEGPEVTCGIYRIGNTTTALPLTEIVSENEFFDYKAKYLGESQEITPARISDELTAEVQKVTKFIYQRLGLKGMARVDYILINNVPHVIEINTTPGLSVESLIPQQIRAAGLKVGDVFDQLIAECLK